MLQTSKQCELRAARVNSTQTWLLAIQFMEHKNDAVAQVIGILQSITVSFLVLQRN